MARCAKIVSRMYKISIYFRYRIGYAIVFVAYGCSAADFRSIAGGVHRFKSVFQLVKRIFQRTSTRNR